jgi:DNA-binding NtrC family response regulator
VGASPAFQALVEQVRAVQDFPKAGVLILGENGTGKELIARAIHFGGARAKAPFIAVNCGRLTRELAESELFGHVRGAFTGATTDRKGCFELAEGGTLFLDELGTMPLELQAKLLRVLEDHRLARLGSASERTIDVRVIAATNAQLEDEIRAGRFREDLYFRLKRFTLRVPALRERPDDIPLLAAHFCRVLATEMGLASAPQLTEEALVALRSYRFPGNVRELKNIIESALIQSRGREIRAEHLNLTAFATEVVKASVATTPSSAENAATESLNLREVELRTIHQAMAKANGNLAQAAPLLGVDRGVIYRRLREAGATGEG